MEMAAYAGDYRTLTIPGPLEAEILDDQPQWHVVMVAPNSERIAAAHLIGRRFGVYLPEYERQISARKGRPAYTVKRPLFPGYLFLFVWGIEKHLLRIRACPGVTRVLYDGSRPAVVPDELIEHMQGIENKMFNQARPKRRRRRRDYYYPDADEVVSVKCYSAWREIEKRDDGARISMLHRALGL